MIIDSLSNISKYVHCLSELKIIDKFIRSVSLADLPLGKTVLNEQIYLNKQVYLGSTDEERQFEVHKLYADVQIVLHNLEYVDCIIDKNNCVIQEKNYDSVNDVFFFNDNNHHSRFLLEEGTFLLIYPGEAHKPCIRINEKTITKIVFKIKL